MLKSVLLVVLGTGVMCYRSIGHATPKPHTFQQPNTPSPSNWKYPSNPSHTYYASHSENSNFQSNSQDKTHEPSGSPTNGPSQTNGESYISSNANLTSKRIEKRDTGQTNQTNKSTVAGDIANNEASETNQTASESPNNQTRNNPPRANYRPTTPRPISGARPVPALWTARAPSIEYHVGIYSKTSTPYEQICGGSLVKADFVISAAHCFWNDDEGVSQAALYAVAAGKLLRVWDAVQDPYAQYSDIAEINVPPRFRGVATSFQDDIAVLRLTMPLEYAPGVKPLCVDFDLALDRMQLQAGREGEVAGWGLTTRNGGPSRSLNYAYVPLVAIESCLRDADPAFLKYITSDKICAGSWGTGQALCRGDSGGGLVYSRYLQYKLKHVPYLRGVASTAPRDNNQCNINAVATFTHIQSHMTFLTDHIPGIAEECRTLYYSDIEDATEASVENATQAFVVDAGTENATQAFVADTDTKNATQVFLADANTENAIQAFVADANTENATQAFVADANTKNAAQTFVADADTENATQAFAADADTKNAAQASVADANTENATQASVAASKTENATQASVADANTENATQAFVEGAVKTRSEENVSEVCQCPEIPEILEMMKQRDTITNVTSSLFHVDEFKVTFNVKGGIITLLWNASP